MKKNKKVKKKIDLKNIIVYLLKVILLFLILFYTFIYPSSIYIVYFITPYFYILGYIVILYILGRLFNKNKSFYKKHIKGMIELIIGVLICFIIYYLINGIICLVNKNNVERFIKESDEVIFYDTNNMYFDKEIPYKLLNDNHRSNAILIDYDTMRVGFIFGEFSEFKLFKLNQDEYVKNDNIQTKVNLKYPGSKFISFFSNENNKHRTSDIEIILNDGKVYNIKNIDDCYLGLANMSLEEGNIIKTKDE